MTVLLAAVLALLAVEGSQAVEVPPTPRPAAAMPASPPQKPLRILSIMTVDTMSHHLWMSPLTVALAKRGHLVDAVDVAMPKEVPPTLNINVIETAFKMMNASLLKSWLDAGLLKQTLLLQTFQKVECDVDLSTPTMQRIIGPANTEHYDLIIMDHTSDCFLGLAHRFNYPGLVLVSPFPGSPWLHDLVGNPTVPAVVPITLLPFPHPMTLWQRAATAAYTAYIRVVHWWHLPEVNELMRKHFGEDVPSVQQLRNNIHLALVNENPVLDMARHYMPNIIPVGGMHVQPPNLSNIPADLREWMDGAKRGFIFVSFGSVMKGANLNKDKVRALVQSFAELPDIRVLWKLEPEVLESEKLPPNLRVQKWVPQNDILGHSKLLLFVSHCGGLSTQESSFQGVPMLGVPFLVDQFLNLDKVVRIGMARRMPFAEITKDRFVAEVKEMVRNPAYRDAARRTSALLRDVQSSPLDTAVWWCEFVGRHHGAPHLRSPALDLSWPQAMLLDVAALAVVAALAAAAIAALLLRACLRCLFCRRPAHKLADTRQKKD